MASDDRKPGDRDDQSAGAPKVTRVVDADEEPGLGPPEVAPLATVDADQSEDDEEAVLPGQMGHLRYVYAAFFTFAIANAYFLSKASVAAWHRLSQYTPKVGEPREDLVTPVAATVAGIVTYLVYRRPDVRALADEVALELSKVEWPTREKVRRSTTIVVTASLGSSLAFWLYDIVTNKAVSFVTGSEHPLLYGVGAGAVIYAVRALGSRFIAGRGT